MAFVHGKGFVFKVDDSAGVLQTLTSYLDSVDWDETVDTAESTTAGAEAKTYLSGQSDTRVSISGKFDSTASTGPDAVLRGIRGLETTSTIEYGPEGGTTGKVKKSAEAFLTMYKVSSPVGDVVSFTADFQISGAVSYGTFA